MSKCFDTIMPELSKVFAERTKGMSISEQQVEGIKIALEKHKELHDELNAFKKSISENPKTFKPDTYVPFDNSAAVKEITDRYNAKIEEKRQQVIPKQEPVQEIKPIQNETTTAAVNEPIPTEAKQPKEQGTESPISKSTDATGQES